MLIPIQMNRNVPKQVTFLVIVLLEEEEVTEEVILQVEEEFVIVSNHKRKQYNQEFFETKLKVEEGLNQS